MTAEIICVGTELLLGDILNTNAQFLSRELAELGISVLHQHVIGDNPARLRELVTQAKNRSDLLIFSGGLGPTEDDLTKETVAEAFGDTLHFDEAEWDKILAFFARTNRRPTENNRKQAMVPTNGHKIINDHGTATAPWRAVNNFDELDAALDDIHYPAVLKTVSGGYDGHGQLVLRSDADLEKIRSRSDRGGGFPPSILEGFVDFAFEASILVSGNGKDFVTFPIVRNEHRNNILHMTIAPAEVSEHVAREAHELAIRLAKGFELAGTLAIELFITKDDQVIVNELAPRPHNSGHYTIEACSMDQFDAHIRGIAGWPLPKPKLLSPAVMVNVLGQHVEPTRALIATHPEWNVHDYGKAEVRHDRKMGHITVLTDDPAKTVADLEATGCWDDLKKKA